MFFKRSLFSHRHAREGGYPSARTIPFIEMDSRLRGNDGDS